MRTDEVSIGDYVLNGGEAAALVMIESVVRLLPGVLGNPESLTEESHAAGQDGLLEYPLYTKPPSWRGLDVPDVLFSGHHARIAGWRRQQAVARTAERRPELLPDPHWQLGEAVLPDAVLSDAVLSDTVLSDTVLSDAVLSDAGELFTLQRAAFFQEAVLNGSMELPPLMQSYEELQASLEHATVLVARRRGRLIGSVRGESWPDDVWYVGRLMVAPDLQGQGLGGRLMTEIEARAPGSTRSFRLVTGRASTQNIDFYRRRGYTSVAYDVDDVGVPIAILEKRLPA
jgi:tRNA (guanine37-N1)-methyltransferase